MREELSTRKDGGIYQSEGHSKLMSKRVLLYVIRTYAKI